MFEQIRDFLVEQLRVKPEEVKMETDLAGDLGVNSLEFAELVYLCEEKFDVVIEDEDLRGFTTVGDIVNYLEEKQK